MAQLNNKTVNIGDLGMYVASPGNLIEPNPTSRSKSGSTERQQELRRRINKKLGGCCVRCGFNDARALHIDHVHGGGQKELRQGQGGGMACYYRVLRDETGKYQLLCANCNAIKRFEEKEAGGMTQHKAKA